MATGPAIVAVDSSLDRQAIERDLSSYAFQWRHLQDVEAQDAYGPAYPEPADIRELNRKGTCIYGVTLRRCMNCIEASWAGNSGRHFAVSAAVVISRTHPEIDRLRSCTVKNIHPGRLELRPAYLDPALDIENGTWRLDLEANCAQYYRISAAIHNFISILPNSPPSPLQLLIGTYFGDSQQRRAINEATGLLQPVDMSALVNLNASQRYAVSRSLDQWLLPIQGLPGTGKTQVAVAIFELWNSPRNLEALNPGPVVGDAPSNVAADNLASRLMKTTSLKVKRYGPPGKIIDAYVLTISSQALALNADSYPLCFNKNAKKRRKHWEIKELTQRNHALIGTLEMSCDLQTEELPWKCKLLVVDEAAQASEPMTIVPFQLTDARSHVVLLGDHMQLAPTVKSKKAEWDGLGTSLFERLMRHGGVDECILLEQYRMPESICTFPSQEFYEGHLLSHPSVLHRDPVKGFPFPLGSALAFVHI